MTIWKGQLSDNYSNLFTGDDLLQETKYKLVLKKMINLDLVGLEDVESAIESDKTSDDLVVYMNDDVIRAYFKQIAETKEEEEEEEEEETLIQKVERLVALNSKYSAMQIEYDALQVEINKLKNEIITKTGEL